MGLVTHARPIGVAAGTAVRRELGRDDLLGRLTPRETDVLSAMAEGRTNAAIAATLFLSRRAIEKHINSIFSKLSLTGDEERHPRVHAVLIYLTHMGVEPSANLAAVPSPAPRHADRVHFHQYARAGRRRTVFGPCGATPRLSAVGR